MCMKEILWKWFATDSCYFSQLVRTLWLVKLASRILLHNTLKAIAVLVFQNFL